MYCQVANGELHLHCVSENILVMSDAMDDYLKQKGIAEKIYPFLDGLSQADINAVINHLKSLVYLSPIVAKQD